MISDDGSVAEKSAISQWGKFFEEGGRALGRTFMVVDTGIQRKAMEEAGFVDIQEWEFKVSMSFLSEDLAQGFGSWYRARRVANTTLGSCWRLAPRQEIEGDRALGADCP